MTRTATTEFLSNLLIQTRLTGQGKYYSREVTLDYGKGKDKQKRVDFMQFTPENQLCASGIEHGYFTCYEVKSCRADLTSGHGMNFICEKNYLVMTMQTYKDCLDVLNEHKEMPPYVGVMVAIPSFSKATDEFENPTPIDERTVGLQPYWKLETVIPCHKTYRKISMNELLFCMLRSGH